METFCSEVNSYMSEALYQSKMPCAFFDTFFKGVNQFCGSFSKVLIKEEFYGLKPKKDIL